MFKGHRKKLSVVTVLGGLLWASSGVAGDVQRTGKPVTLHIGPGVNQTVAQDIAATLETAGCSTSIQADGLFDNAIDVEVAGNFETFDTIRSVRAFALELCLPKNGSVNTASKQSPTPITSDDIVEALRQSCDSNASACWLLANFFESGEFKYEGEVYRQTVDSTAASLYYIFGCKGGMRESCLRVSKIYASRTTGNLELNKIFAMDFLQIACELGHGRSCTVVGAQYGNSNVKTLCANHTEKCEELGITFEGISHDFLQASFYKKGCKNGYEDACRLLKVSEEILQLENGIAEMERIMDKLN